jgi:beta-xylosidase
LKVLSALLDKDHFLRPLDELEGTAKGAWLTTRWQSPKNDQSRYEEISPPSFKQLTSLQQRYLEWLTQSRSVQQEHSQP